MGERKFEERVVFETPRLKGRLAEPVEEDVELLYSLWTDPRVMVNVGFPTGLRVSREEIMESLKRAGKGVWSRHLIVVLKRDNPHEGGLPIGEAWMSVLDGDGVAETDVKLLPSQWGHGYGVEVKRGLVDYLFTHSECTAVKATPNVSNIASIKMQEAVGGVRVGEEVSEVPEGMLGYAVPVHHYIYLVYRENWEKY